MLKALKERGYNALFASFGDFEQYKFYFDRKSIHSGVFHVRKYRLNEIVTA